MAVLRWQAKFLSEITSSIGLDDFDILLLTWSTAKGIIWSQAELRVSQMSVKSVIQRDLDEGVRRITALEADLVARAREEMMRSSDSGVPPECPLGFRDTDWPQVYEEYYPRYLATICLAAPMECWREFETRLLNPPFVITPNGWRPSDEIVDYMEHAMSHPGPKSKKEIALSHYLSSLALLGYPRESIAYRIGHLAMRLLSRVLSYR